MSFTNARRIGRFTVSLRCFETLNDGEMLYLFKDMIVLQAQTNAWVGLNIDYIGVHPDFRKVAEGEVPPKYEAYIARSGSGYFEGHDPEDTVVWVEEGKPGPVFVARSPVPPGGYDREPPADGYNFLDRPRFTPMKRLLARRRRHG
jgi:hypothetical protein